jgi:hypothetical protein
MKTFGENMKQLILFAIISLFIGCAQITLEPSDLAWPIESVLEIDEDGFIKEERYSLSTNVISLFAAEKNDSSSYLNESVRIIRDSKGYYFLTANEFKNVYVFNVDDGKFIQINKILISEFGLDLPAFNQRKPNIEVLDGEQHIVFINSDGIKGEE